MASIKHEPVSNQTLYTLLTEVREDVKQVLSTVSDHNARLTALETENSKNAEVTKRWWDDWARHGNHHEEFEKETKSTIGLVRADFESFKARVGVYIAIAGALGAACVGVILHLLHLS